MKVAVIGSSGFVGSHVLRVLRAGGDDARAVVRNPRFAATDENCRIADALDVYALRDALAGCECVVLSVLGTQEVILGTLAPVYAAAQAVGIRRIAYISTGVVHGQAPRAGTVESSPLHVRHAFPYNNAKVRAERKLLRLRARGTVEVVMLRPTIVFGPRSRWVDGFASALHDGSAYVVDGGRGICNTIYVDNLAHAIRLALVAPNVDGEAFLVGDDETVTWRDLWQPMAAALAFDFQRVPSFSPPAVAPTFRQLYVEPIRTSEVGQSIIPRVPVHLKRALKGTYRLALRARRSVAGSDRLRASGEVVERAEAVGPGPHLEGPAVTTEIVELHRCEWKLPNDKARRLLGYVPPVSFAEGVRRSAVWLQQQYGRPAPDARERVAVNA